MFHKIKQAHDILLDQDLKSQFEKYKQNQKHHEERTKKQTKERRKFAEDLLAKEKHAKDSEETEKKTTKEDIKREDVMKKHIKLILTILFDRTKE